AEVGDGQTAQGNGKYGYIVHEGSPDSVTAVGIAGDTESAVQVLKNRYLVVAVPPSDTEREFTVAVWKGSVAAGNVFEAQLEKYRDPIPAYRKGGNQRWKDHVITQGQLSPDTAAFVTDVLTLPLPNPWARNFRVADIAFFDDGRAAVSTYEGDVWIVSGIDNRLNRLKWQRFASGLYEPMSIEIVDNEVFVYGKEGIVRLRDLNADGEADYYENFSNLMNQSIGTREWAADMVADKNGNFYIAKGGHITGYKGVEPLLSENGKKTNWRSSSIHSGTLMKISSSGREAEMWATGLRMPYIGLNRDNAFLSASDQQGNFVPATPIYAVNQWDYFGVPLTLHRDDAPEIRRPITWIPHRVDRSGISQTWINSKHMGPLNGQMVHFSFGRPGIFRVLIDTVQAVLQGGVTFIDTYYPAPVMKGEIHPKDGLLYIAGFNNYASNSTGISALTRLRYTGKPSYLVNGIFNTKQGIVLSFDTPLDQQSANDRRAFQVKRWNYQRTSDYGSPHYRLDGRFGEEAMPVLASYLSEDSKHVLLVVQDHREVDQLEILYDLTAADGHPIQDGVWSTVNKVAARDLTRWGFHGLTINVDSLAKEFEQTSQPEMIASVAQGAKLFRQMGCSGCHATTPEQDKGMYGPPLFGKVGTQQRFTDGTTVVVDDTYLQQSILSPSLKIVKGYSAEMPSFEGVLSEADLNSIILYINTL
ncbi:cytochrome c, partial [Parapedobacter defluvii]|uniref:c-type cytochrome n=1 Tax=Parapedobacter defluvii TaxID=2045106 RepID=UPI00333F12F0